MTKQIDIQKNYNIIIELIKEHCKDRVDIDKLIKMLNDTDYFTAPASTKYHLNIRGGLAQHSLDVYNTLDVLAQLYDDTISKTTIVITSLFHDLCKANFYKQELKNIKVGNTWTQTTIYVVDDQLPLGHGEKSVIMLLRLGFRLTDDEIYAIRWHMGGFDCATKGGDFSMSAALNKSKLIGLLQAADTIAATVLE